MEQPITPVQQKILEFIVETIDANGVPPTVREIGRRVGIDAPSSVSYHLDALQQKGLLKRLEGTSRGLVPTERPGLPILGRVGAGGGMLAQDDVQGHFTFREFTYGADYLLRVKGDSMEGAGIFEGDLVQVRRQPTADDGDIVVAVVEGEEGVVKVLRRTGRAFALESANPRYSPIVRDFQVVGVVLGLVRRYH